MRPNGDMPPPMRAATAGTPGRRGLVPMPPAGSQTKFLRGDGTFQAIAGGGDMLAANNLGDVASAATARTNLGLGSGNTVTFTGTLLGNGSAAAPSVSFSSDTGTGFYSNSAGQMAFSSAGTLSLIFYSGGQIFGSGAAGYPYLMLNGATGAISLVAAGTNQNITLTPSGTGYSTNFGGSGEFRTGVTTTQLFYCGANGANIAFCGSYTNHPFLIAVNAAEVARFFTNGRFGIGTGSTDSGALLQIGTNTKTSAGGVVFGTDTFLYRINAGILETQGAAAAALYLAAGGSQRGYFYADSSNVYLSSTTAGASLILKSGAEVTALTLDGSQNATFAGYVSLGTGFSLFFNGRGSFRPNSDGVFQLANSANTDFSRLQFGGTTASFPSLKRSSTSLHVRLADDSGWSPIAAETFTATAAASATNAGEIAYGATTAATVGAAGGASALPATPVGYIIINVAGTQRKIPYYNN